MNLQIRRARPLLAAVTARCLWHVPGAGAATIRDAYTTPGSSAAARSASSPSPATARSSSPSPPRQWRRRSRRWPQTRADEPWRRQVPGDLERQPGRNAFAGRRPSVAEHRSGEATCRRAASPARRGGGRAAPTRRHVPRPRPGPRSLAQADDRDRGGDAHRSPRLSSVGGLSCTPEPSLAHSGGRLPSVGWDGASPVIRRASRSSARAGAPRAS